MSGFSVFQIGNGLNFAVSSVRGGGITQIGTSAQSLSVASGFNTNAIGGSGRAIQTGTPGNDTFTVQKNTSNGQFFLNGAGGMDALNLPQGTLRFGNAFFNPATGTGVFAVGIERVNFFS
jgi:hypothetical protein